MFSKINSMLSLENITEEVNHDENFEYEQTELKHAFNTVSRLIFVRDFSISNPINDASYKALNYDNFLSNTFTNISIESINQNFDQLNYVKSVEGMISKFVDRIIKLIKTIIQKIKDWVKSDKDISNVNVRKAYYIHTIRNLQGFKGNYDRRLGMSRTFNGFTFTELNNFLNSNSDIDIDYNNNKDLYVSFNRKFSKLGLEVNKEGELVNTVEKIRKELTCEKAMFDNKERIITLMNKLIDFDYNIFLSKNKLISKLQDNLEKYEKELLKFKDNDTSEAKISNIQKEIEEINDSILQTREVTRYYKSVASLIHEEIRRGVHVYKRCLGETKYV